MSVPSSSHNCNVCQNSNLSCERNLLFQPPNTLESSDLQQTLLDLKLHKSQLTDTLFQLKVQMPSLCKGLIISNRSIKLIDVKIDIAKELICKIKEIEKKQIEFQENCKSINSCNCCQSFCLPSEDAPLNQQSSMLTDVNMGKKLNDLKEKRRLFKQTIPALKKQIQITYLGMKNIQSTIALIDIEINLTKSLLYQTNQEGGHQDNIPQPLNSSSNIG